jgi:hypothetical protein
MLVVKKDTKLIIASTRVEINCGVTYAKLQHILIEPVVANRKSLL